MSFSPTDIAGCLLWLDASQETGKSDGDTLTTVTDHSGNANTGTPTAITYKTGIANGLPSYRFNGSTSHIDLTSVLSPNDCTVFVVAKPASPISYNSGAKCIFSRTTSTTPRTWFGLGGNIASVFSNELISCFAVNPGVKGVYYSDSVNSISAASIISFRLNGSAEEIRWDRVTKSLSEYDGGLNSSTTTRFINVNRIGSDYDISNSFSGDVLEIIIYNSALSSEDMNSVEGYLTNKWFSTYALEDASLDLAAYYRSLEDLQSLLRAHDGLELEDLRMSLHAGSPITLDDVILYLATQSQELKDLSAFLYVAGTGLTDFAAYLQAVSPVVLSDLGAWLQATDGTAIADIGMRLSAIKAIPSFHSVSAQRLSSVLREAA